MDLDDGEYHDETLPYAKAGMAVIHYSLDGGSEVFESEKASIKAPYLHFRAACAGVINTRNALELALAKLPMVDPGKVFTAGHSSAGTLALLAAEHEPRIAGAAAFAPAADVEKRMKEFQDAPAAVTGLAFPRMKEFITQSSPATHAAALKCPVFLFHSKDDENVPFGDTEAFAAKLRTSGKDVTLEAVDSVADGARQAPAVPARPPGFDVGDAASGDEEMSDEEFDESDGYDSHYTPMIKEGIPRAINWIKQKAGT
jgi:dienelactone hydrolase